MSEILWDQVGERIYETGVDRGVLYLADGRGVPWNGLTGIDENVAETAEPFYIDGVKYVDIPSIEDYAAQLTALTYPDEFLDYDGVVDLGGGVYATDQPSKRFGLSYRTLVGNDTEGLEKGYKIHVVYDLTAQINTKTSNTLSNSTTPEEFSWNISAVPQYISGYRPTAHLILDTTRLNRFLVASIEEILYGNDENEPRLPSLTEMAEFVLGWDLFTVTDNGDGTWSITGPDELITMINSTTFRITEINAVYLDDSTYTITTTE